MNKSSHLPENHFITNSVSVRTRFYLVRFICAGYACLVIICFHFFLLVLYPFRGRLLFILKFNSIFLLFRFSKHRFSTSEHRFSTSELRFCGSELRFSTSEHRFRYSKYQIRRSESRFRHSESRFPVKKIIQ
jgi:hypothetical protein